jgi:tetratricopeptide (TPR) repeat protein
MGFFLILFLMFITRPFTVLFHELGHAIPAIFMTRQQVSIYLGSYGDPKKSLNFAIGHLDVWFKYNPFSWQGGLCVPSAKEISIYKQIIITLTGPLSSFFIATIASYTSFTFDLHGSLKLILVVFFISSIFDLLINLIPNNTPIQLYNGSMIYNDGYKLRQLFSNLNLLKECKKAVELYNAQKFAKAGILFHKILKSGIKDENIYRLAIVSFVEVMDYNQAKEISDEFNLLGHPNSDDYSNAGLIYSRLDQYEKALEFYDKSLHLNPLQKNSLNNKGFTLILIDKFQDAIELFDKAIEIDEAFAYPYNNRGLAKIKTGKAEEGLEDIYHSFKLDENNPYAYRNLGIYHLDKGEYSKALDLFIKAKRLDHTTHKIDELISKVKIIE